MCYFCGLRQSVMFLVMLEILIGFVCIARSIVVLVSGELFLNEKVVTDDMKEELDYLITINTWFFLVTSVLSFATAFILLIGIFMYYVLFFWPWMIAAVIHIIGFLVAFGIFLFAREFLWSLIFLLLALLTAGLLWIVYRYYRQLDSFNHD